MSYKTIFLGATFKSRAPEQAFADRLGVYFSELISETASTAPPIQPRRHPPKYAISCKCKHLRKNAQSQSQTVNFVHLGIMAVAPTIS